MLEIAKQKQELVIRETHAKTAQQLEYDYSQYSEKPLKEHLLYPNKKGIDPIGVKFSTREGFKKSLVVPIRDADGKLWDVQYIYASTGPNAPKSGIVKQFAPYATYNGCFHTINDEQIIDGSIIYVCEGWATGVSIYKAIKADNIFVVSAMCANNIPKVVTSIHNKFTSCEFIIASDDDSVGRKAAEEAASKFGGKVTYPECDEGKGKDFNDVHMSRSLAEVRRQLGNFISFESDIVKAAKLAGEYLQIKDPCADFDIEALPPILKNLTKSICETTSAHPIIITGSLIATASGFIKTRYYFPQVSYETDGFFDATYTNIWTLCVAPSGNFKSTAMRKGSRYAFECQDDIVYEMEELKRAACEQDDEKIKKEMLKELGSKLLVLSRKNMVLPERMTPEGLFDYIGKGHKGTMYLDEFAGFMKYITRPGSSDAIATLTSTYSVPSSCRYVTKTQGESWMKYPFISIFGISTLDWLNGAVRNEDIMGGFYPRFLIYSLPGDDSIPPAWPSRPKPNYNSHYDQYVQVIRGLVGSRQYGIKPYAFDRYLKYYNIIYNMISDFPHEIREFLKAFAARWAAYLIKIGMIMETFINPFSSDISEDAIDAAFAFILPAIKSTISLFQTNLGESKFKENCTKVFIFMCEMIKDKKSVTRRDLAQDCWIYKNLQPKERDDILKALVDDGKIIQTEVRKNSFAFTLNLSKD
jgi:hypothetical protein